MIKFQSLTLKFRFSPREPELPQLSLFERGCRRISKEWSLGTTKVQNVSDGGIRKEINFFATVMRGYTLHGFKECRCRCG